MCDGKSRRHQACHRTPVVTGPATTFPVCASFMLPLQMYHTLIFDSHKVMLANSGNSACYVRWIAKLYPLSDQLASKQARSFRTEVVVFQMAHVRIL